MLCAPLIEFGFIVVLTMFLTGGRRVNDLEKIEKTIVSSIPIFLFIRREMECNSRINPFA